jgi:hypothetical protein
LGPGDAGPFSAGEAKRTKNVLRNWLGRSEISTTERIYAHFADRSNLPTSDKIAEAFGESKVVEVEPPKPASGPGDDGPEM